MNYYEILGVNPEATQIEIKKSFRRKAKELHPDINPSAEEHMRILLKAYQTLSDPMGREEYNRTYYRFIKPKYQFNYRNFLKEQKNDFYYQSKLIFHDLLHNNPDEAMELYEQLCRIYALNIREYLEREDYMDCCFLLAEEYEKRGEFVKAYQHLKIIVLEEQLKAYFRHFIEEVVDRLRTITCFKMPSILPPRLILDYLNELINFDFSKKDNAFFYKKISEVYAELGDEETAVHFLQKGLSLDKNLAGVKKLKDKLGYTQAS